MEGVIDIKTEVHRELSNVYIGNQLLEEKETIIYYSDGTFTVVPPERTKWNEEEEGIYSE